ncbi:transferase [Lithospermum erythrorhizon]|uniref:Transferase n=1 Tax=Lithospermum erythrorhizon TaxID=34254 RepID=A0AAV3QRD9_LITER
MKPYRAHILVIPYPVQGHINPMLQLSKRLVSKGLRATIAITKFISKTMQPKVDSLNFDTISDGYDEFGFAKAPNVHTYLEKLETEGSRTLNQLLRKQETLGHPIDCIIYDAQLPWALDVAKENEMVGAAFFTQPCGVNYVYYRLQQGLIELPLDSSKPVSIPGLPLMDPHDMPSFVDGSYPAYFELVLNQYNNVQQADLILVNSFYKLEEKVCCVTHAHA